MTTYYTLPDGRQTANYQCWKDANAEHTAAQAAFDARFGAALSTPESRRAAVEAMRSHALRNAGIENIAPAAPRFQGGLTEAQVERRVDVAMTGTVHRNGSVGFAVPSASEPVMSNADGMPPGAVPVSFFGGMPKKIDLSALVLRLAPRYGAPLIPTTVRETCTTMHKIFQTDAPAAVPAHERTAAEARYVARVLAAEGKRAAALGLDAAPYNEMAGSYLDKAASAYAGAAQ